MTIDMTPLLSPLVRSEHAVLGPEDESLNAMDTLAQHDRFVEAAAQVQSLLARAIYDMRALPYFFFAAFLEGGFGVLPVVFRAIDNLLGASYTAVDPERRREDYCNKRLAWLFAKIDHSLEYHEQNGTDDWARWQEGLTVAHLDGTIDAAGVVGSRLTARSSMDASLVLGRLVGRLRTHREHLTPKLAPESDSTTAPETADDTDRKDSPANPAGRSARSDGTRVPEQPCPSSASGGPAKHDLPASDGNPQQQGPLVDPRMARPALHRIELLVDAPFIQLCRKLKGFETLIRKQQFARAAVLAESIADSLAHFDPRAHFSQLFADYAGLRSKYVQELSRSSERRDSPEWAALAEHAEIDLERFVEP